MEDLVELAGRHGGLGEVHHPRVEAAGALEIVDVVVERVEAADADGLELHGDLFAGRRRIGLGGGYGEREGFERGAGGLDTEQGGELRDVDVEAAGAVELRDDEEIAERDRCRRGRTCPRRRGRPPPGLPWSGRGSGRRRPGRRRGCALAATSWSRRSGRAGSTSSRPRRWRGRGRGRRGRGAGAAERGGAPRAIRGWPSTGPGAGPGRPPRPRGAGRWTWGSGPGGDLELLALGEVHRTVGEGEPLEVERDADAPGAGGTPVGVQGQGHSGDLTGRGWAVEPFPMAVRTLEVRTLVEM